MFIVLEFKQNLRRVEVVPVCCIDFDAEIRCIGEFDFLFRLAVLQVKKNVCIDKI